MDARVAARGARNGGGAPFDASPSAVVSLVEIVLWSNVFGLAAGTASALRRAEWFRERRGRYAE
jgi:hypothetical protein